MNTNYCFDLSVINDNYNDRCSILRGKSGKQNFENLCHHAHNIIFEEVPMRFIFCGNKESKIYPKYSFEFLMDYKQKSGHLTF